MLTHADVCCVFGLNKEASTILHHPTQEGVKLPHECFLTGTERRAWRNSGKVSSFVMLLTVQHLLSTGSTRFAKTKSSEQKTSKTSVEFFPCWVVCPVRTRSSAFSCMWQGYVSSHNTKGELTTSCMTEKIRTEQITSNEDSPYCSILLSSK